MSDFSELISEKLKKNSKETAVDLMKKSKVKNSIMNLINENLQMGDDLIIEVGPQDLSYAMVVLYEEPIRSLVTVDQIGNTLFKLRLKDIDLW